MQYTKNWFTQHIPAWNSILSPLKGKPIKAIEIGSFEGMSTVWLFENILTHPDAHLDSVDPYKPYLEKPYHLGKEVMIDVEKRFHENTAQYEDKLTCHKMSSFDYLKQRTEPADLIYIDGDHSARACMIDAVQAHLILNPGGILIFDDYLWVNLFEGVDVPKGAINAFMECFAPEYELLGIGYQVYLRKTVLK